MQGKKLDFLLGAVSPMGFTGYFNQASGTNYKNSFLIKAGPGCGKSTLMKKIANSLSENNNDIELIHCSSDPDSLDGVICNDKSFSIIDATAPHTIEPSYPVAAEQVLSFYEFIDTKKMMQNQDKVVALFKTCQSLQERASRYITAAGSLINDSARSASICTDHAKLENFATNLANKLIPNSNSTSKEEFRLLSATSCKGQIFYIDTIFKLSTKKLIIIEDEYGCCAKAILKIIRDTALAKKHNIITCYCPMSPHEKIEHIFIPSLGIGFVTSNSFHEIKSDNVRVIHCKRFMSKDCVTNKKSRMRFNRKAAIELLKQASSLQKEAKQNHDKLENYYKSAIDFNKVDKLCKQMIEKTNSL